MAGEASMNVEPVKSSSEIHNLRKKELDYVVKKDSHLNEHLVLQEIAPTLREIKERYKTIVKQKWQDKATPIRDGVVVMNENVTMDDLKILATKLQERFGIKMMQIHIHRDEGHYLKNVKPKTWKPNLHAHMIFDWTDHSTGKVIALKIKDMCELQDIVAECTHMARGKKSSKKHLTAIQYKNKMEEEHLERLESEKEKLIEENTKLRNHAITKGLSKMVGVDADTKKIKELTNKFDKVYEAYIELEQTSTTLQSDYQKASEALTALQIKSLALEAANKQLNDDNVFLVKQHQKDGATIEENNKTIKEKEKWLKMDTNYLIALVSEKTTPERKLEALEYANKLTKIYETEKKTISPSRDKGQQHTH